MPESLAIEYENLAHSNRRFMPELENAAKRVIRSGWYVLGEEVAAFEKEFADYVGVKHCIGVASGLDALILSIEALDLPEGSDILVASNTYIATIIAIVRAGHKPVLVEPVLETFNIDPDRLEKVMTSNTKAICVTHLFGKPCRMDQICAFSEEHGLKVIEDCAQSHGARFGEKMTGAFGDAGCFSFYPTKNLGAIGDGGCVVTDDDALSDRLRHIRNYGSNEKYVNRYVGANSRLDELHAAMLRVKLRYLDDITEHKRMLSDVYFSELPEHIIKPVRNKEEFDVFHIYAIRHHKRDELRQYLFDNGIKTEIHYPIPPHHQAAMQGIISGNYPISEELHATELSLPISVGHSKLEIERVVNAVDAFVRKNSG